MKLLNDESVYIVSGFYHKVKYVCEFICYNFDGSVILDLTLYRKKAQKLSMNLAIQAAKELKSKGFVNINIEEVK